MAVSTGLYMSILMVLFQWNHLLTLTSVWDTSLVNVTAAGGVGSFKPHHHHVGSWQPLTPRSQSWITFHSFFGFPGFHHDNNLCAVTLLWLCRPELKWWKLSTLLPDTTAAVCGQNDHDKKMRSHRALTNHWEESLFGHMFSNEKAEMMFASGDTSISGTTGHVGFY